MSTQRINQSCNKSNPGNSQRAGIGKSVFLLVLGLAAPAWGQFTRLQPELQVEHDSFVIADGSTIEDGRAVVGETDGIAFRITNTGNGPLELPDEPVITGDASDEFSIGIRPSFLAPGASIFLSVRFAPTASGARSATIIIPNNSPNAPAFSCLIKATGLVPPRLQLFDDNVLVDDGDTIQVEEIQVNDTVEKALTIRNSGEAPLVFTSAQHVIVEGIDADQFDATLFAPEIQPGGQAFLLLSFTPTRIGDARCTIRIPNNDPSREDFTVSVLGTTEASPTAPEVSWEDEPATSGDTLDFADVTVGETTETELRLSGLSESNVRITSVRISGEAAADYSTPFTVITPESSVSVNASTTYTGALFVTPSAPGRRTATLTIVNDSADGDIILQLSTNGIAAVIDCNLNGIDDAADLLDGSEDCNTNSVPDECETDTDDDGVIDACDNCVTVANAEQDDFDEDGFGDLCDNCEGTSNADQVDTDGDEYGDACDNCPQTPNLDQADTDDDGIGDVCDTNEEQDEDDPQDDDQNGDDPQEDDGQLDDDRDVEDGQDNDDQVVEENGNNDDAGNNNNDDGNEDETGSNDDGNGNGNDNANFPRPEGNFCGLGVAGMIPAMMFGICGMRPRRRA